MQDYIYSVIAFLAMVIHLIINFDMLPGRKISGSRGAREYRGFLAGVFAYYITDAGWGVFAGLGWTRVLYLDTMVYYIAIAVSVLTLCRFVIAYVGVSGWRSRILFWFGYALLGLYVVLLASNLFNNCLFWFDTEGAYHAGPLRHLIFYPLAVFVVVMAFFSFVRFLSSQDVARRRNMVVFLFCLTMAVAVVLQIVWPLWPFYALGCLVGNCFFHVFVIEDERAELRQAAIEQEQTAKHLAEVENALERARAAEQAKSLFFSTVSHDIRTPLNAIIGFSELLRNGIEDKEEQKQALDAITTSGQTLLDLINDVLDLSKLDAGKIVFAPELTDINKLASGVLHSFDISVLGRDIVLEDHVAPIPYLFVDPHRIRQILFNLIGNAVKFTEHGKVSLYASFEKNPISMDETGCLTFSVSDTGCGIAEDDQENVLKPFVQAKTAKAGKGTGLGLSICCQLAERMGGKLTMKSALGKGSTFTVKFPNVRFSTREKPKSEDTTGRIAIGSAQKKSLASNLPRILIVDDVPVNVKVIQSMLRRLDITDVVSAGNGAEALEILRSDTSIGIVLTDMWMPVMDGEGLIREIRSRDQWKDLRVYAVTADVETRKTYKDSGFTGILLKPIKIGQLQSIIESADGIAEESGKEVRMSGRFFQ